MKRESPESRIAAHITTLLVAALLAIGTAAAQVVTGTLGQPSATTTIPGNQIPAPAPKFGGVIKETLDGSKTWWPPRIVPPKGAPNVLLIMTDDQGYGVSGTFGGVIPTPVLDRVAKAGLRYTEFNSTALCSPTRAAIITGRNHHSGGFGVITELSTGFPGYDSIIGQDNATIGRILKDNGYATSWFGKDHNTPDFQYSVAGPFDQWPSGMGFDYFYGFLYGRRDRPVDALPVREQPPGFPMGRQGRLQPHHGHGRQGDRIHARSQGRCA
jgi:arylsulfatase